MAGFELSATLKEFSVRLIIGEEFKSYIELSEAKTSMLKALKVLCIYIYNTTVLHYYSRIAGVKLVHHFAGRHGNFAYKVVAFNVQKVMQMRPAATTFFEKEKERKSNGTVHDFGLIQSDIFFIQIFQVFNTENL